MAKREVDPGSDQGDGEGGPGLDRKRRARLVAGGVAGVLLVWFAVGNWRRVPIEFWVHRSQAPLILVIVISGLLGAAIALLATRRRPRRD
ncbi:MAG TPA: hypothetical protein VG298_04455 [Acidimicrobiales bacterium]|jgi:uncharacterized integral membrane protein|nr:hypothetical protein [Acidimicrobiales bacterium]